jgi:predicted Rossmann fold nucleotide-binding protein DprA/Smf involved in DNA uptake
VLYLTASDRVRDYLKKADIGTYLASIDATYALGGNFKLWHEIDYPENLRLWKGRPPVLFYKGDLSKLKTRALALVGRVDPSDTGLESAHRFARLCVEHGIAVVSGLAKGIDAQSHRAALEVPPGDTPCLDTASTTPIPGKTPRFIKASRTMVLLSRNSQQVQALRDGHFLRATR